MKNFYKVLFFITATVLSSAFYEGFSQTPIAQWTFEGDVITPSAGTGTTNLLPGNTASFATGNPTGRAWNTSTYPAQGTEQGARGVQFTVSTAGYQNIVVSWDQRHSNTAANRVRLKYTLNGTTWLDFAATITNATNLRKDIPRGFDNGRYIADTGDSWYIRTANLMTITGANNNSAFAFRIVSEFVDGTNYAASTPSSAYATSGTWRFDNVTIAGTLISGISPAERARMEIGPNPTSGSVKITLPEAGMNLRIYNAQGQLVISSKTERAETWLNLSKYGKGVYIVESGYENKLPIARSKVIVY